MKKAPSNKYRVANAIVAFYSALKLTNIRRVSKEDDNKFYVSLDNGTTLTCTLEAGKRKVTASNCCNNPVMPSSVVIPVPTLKKMVKVEGARKYEGDRKYYEKEMLENPPMWLGNDETALKRWRRAVHMAVGTKRKASYVVAIGIFTGLEKQEKVAA